MMPGYFPDDPEKVAERSTAARVAAMMASGSNPHAISQELGISYSKVRTIMKSDECLRVMREIANHEKEIAKAEVASSARALVNECFRVLKDALKKNNLKAVPIVLRACGAFDEVEQVKNDAQLVVVMPGATPPAGPVIDVTPEKVQDEQHS